MPTDNEFIPSGTPDIRTNIEFIKLVETVALGSQFDPEELEDLLNPVEHPIARPGDRDF